MEGTHTTSEKDALYKTLAITEIREEVQGVKTFVFEGGQANEIVYKPGQYLTLAHTEPGTGREVRRSYSITSTPVLSEPLSIGVKRIENGFFSRRLVDDARVGDQVLTTGAAGFFTLPEDMAPYRQVFLLAAGSGITPVYALLKTLLFAHPAVDVVLLYSNRSREKTIYLKPLEQFARQFPDRLRIEFLFSNTADLSRARLHRELLHTFLKAYALASYDQALFYICGPANYMRLCFYVLRQADVPGENIRKESFNTGSAVPRIAPPDTAPHAVTLRLKEKEYTVLAQYPHTILRAAREQGLVLPYSCETGKCGNCVARILKGKVWMSYNEVLTDREINNGLVLTCTGFPVGGDVVLDIL